MRSSAKVKTACEKKHSLFPKTLSGKLGNNLKDFYIAGF